MKNENQNGASIADLMEQDDEAGVNPNDLTDINNARRFAEQFKAGAYAEQVNADPDVPNALKYEISNEVFLCDAGGKQVAKHRFLMPTENRTVIITEDAKTAYCLETNQTVVQRKGKVDLIVCHYREIPVQCAYALMNVFETYQGLIAK